MSANEVLIDLIGGVALMLWALRMVRTGVMRSFGSNLRWLGSAMRNRLSAFGAGLGTRITIDCFNRRIRVIDWSIRQLGSAEPAVAGRPDSRNPAPDRAGPG